MACKRKGMGKGRGKGYRNLISKDKKVHSDSAKGRKQPQQLKPQRMTKQRYRKVQEEAVADVVRDYIKKNEWDKKFAKSYGARFADVRIYTDKEMESEVNNDPSKGWTGVLSGITDKKKDSNVMVLVTFDGAGYDDLNYEGGGAEKIQKMLDKRFGKEAYIIEHYTNWAFQIYKG